MKSKVITGIMLTLLFIGVFTLALNIQLVKADPTTICVDDDNTAGPWDGTPEHPYQNMTSALEHASVNDTIYVYNGTYYEHVIVNKSVSLIGENEQNTIIDGNQTGTVIEVTAHNVTIRGFTVQNSGHGTGESGIKVHYFSNNDISYSIIKNSHYGILLVGSSNNVVLSCDILNNTHTGIYLQFSTNNILSGNVISDNTWGTQVFSSDKNSFSENKVFLNKEQGIYLYDSCENALFCNNLSKNGWNGIYLAVDSNNNTVSCNNISGNEYGISLASCGNNTIYHNNFINNTKAAHPIPAFPPFNNVWDIGYLYGGNYWSDCIDADQYRGPYQNETGSDGIRDHPYVIDENNKDNYPLMKPYGVAHDIGITNVTTSKTAVVQGYKLSINITTVNYGLNDETFNAIVYHDDLTAPSPNQADTFWGKGDVNRDGYIDLIDLNLVTAAMGSKSSDPDWNPDFDLNGDLEVNIIDVSTIGLNFGSDVWTYFELSPSPIGKQSVTLTSGNSTVVIFIWSTTGVPYSNYTITANATIVPGETDTTDNIYTDGTVTIVKPPSANFTYSPEYPAPNQIVTFDATLSTQDGGNITSYAWNFGDGNTTTTAYPIITHVYTLSGTYTITLNVTDLRSNWDTDTVTIEVLDRKAPVADAGRDQTVEEDTLVTFDGSRSTDNVAPTNYTWTFMDVTLQTLPGKNPTYTFRTPGTYMVTLNVTDAARYWDTDQVTITVLDGTDPVADAGPDQKVDEDSLLIFDASASSDNVEIVNYTWTFIDQTPQTLSGPNPKIPYVFATPGTYIVTLNVTDLRDNWDTDTMTVTVRAIPVWNQSWFQFTIFSVPTIFVFLYLIFRYGRREGVYEQLQKLVRKRVRDIITEEEFEEKLRKLEERSGPDSRARINEYLPPIKTLELALRLIDEQKKEKK